MTLGVISNPFSRTNARTRLNDRLLPRFVPDHNNAIDTRTVDDLDQALRTLLFDRGVNVLGLNGGDGTLHVTVNRLAALSREVQATTGRPLPMPPLLFLNGGTLNIVARASGTKGNPLRTLRRFARFIEDGACLGDLPIRSLPVLSVTPQGQESRFGFVFGSEIVANALEMYTMFGEGYAGLGRFMVELLGGYTLHTRLWQEHGWKLDAPTTSIRVDGVTWPRYLAVVASTIDLSILKGTVTAIRVPQGTGFVAKVVLETHPGRAIRLIPRLMFEQEDPRVHTMADPDEFEIAGGYTLDGEVFLDRSPSAQRRLISVRRADFEVPAIALA
ncbi:MAG: hypothetical protein ACI9WU_001070 [Myxococcota bacterium]